MVELKFFLSNEHGTSQQDDVKKLIDASYKDNKPVAYVRVSSNNKTFIISYKDSQPPHDVRHYVLDKGASITLKGVSENTYGAIYESCINDKKLLAQRLELLVNYFKENPDEMPVKPYDSQAPQQTANASTTSITPSRP